MTEVSSANCCAIAHANVVRRCWPFNTPTQPTQTDRGILIGRVRHTIDIIDVEYEHLTALPIRIWQRARDLLLELAERGDGVAVAAALTQLLALFDTCGAMTSYGSINQEMVAFQHQLQGITQPDALLAG